MFAVSGLPLASAVPTLQVLYKFSTLSVELIISHVALYQMISSVQIDEISCISFVYKNHLSYQFYHKQTQLAQQIFIAGRMITTATQTWGAPYSYAGPVHLGRGLQFQRQNLLQYYPWK